MDFKSIQTKRGLLNLSSGYVSEKGHYRKQNEDVVLIITDFLTQYPKECHEFSIKENPFALFAVFDGHGGAKAALFTQEHLPRRILLRSRETTDHSQLLRQSIIDIERLFLQTGFEDGTTALITIIAQDGRFTVANLGDCEGLLVYQPLHLADRHHRPLIRKEPLYSFAPHNLNRSPSEICRVTEAKGEIIDHRLCLRNSEGKVLSLLAVSRAIGDRVFKRKTPISSFPDIQERKLTGFEDSIVMACDGLWDVLSHEDIFLAVEKCRERDLNPVDTAQLLITLAYQSGSTDNVTAIVIFFERD